MEIKNLLKNKRVTNIIIIFIVGILAIYIGSGSAAKKEKTTEETRTGTFTATEIETRLEQILSTIDGAGKVKVFVMLEDFGSSEYVKDIKQTVRDNVSENDEQTVITGKTGSAEPILVKSSAPKIGGVIVSAKGAGNPDIKARIKAAVETSLSVPSYKVEVVKMK